MKLKTALLTALAAVSLLSAHRVLIMVDDNADGTVTIETGLSSGGNAGGAKLFITDRATGRPLWQGVVPESGTVTAKRPNVPYSVTLSMSEGHAITQAGPELLPIKTAEVPDTAQKADTTEIKSPAADSAAAK